jgi:hypothetical protein
MQPRSSSRQCESKTADSRLIPAKPSPALLAAALVGLGPVLTTACGHSHDEEPGMITSSVVDPSLTEGWFRQECDERDGKVETHPHCGGVNTCKGMSYDVTTHVLTEHTCRGLNTCAGYSCVVPDE